MVTLFSSVKDSFDLTSLAGYPGEDTLDIVSSEVAPRLTIYSLNEKLQSMIANGGASNSGELLDSAMMKVGDAEARS